MSPDIEYLLKWLIIYGHHPYRPYKPLQAFTFFGGVFILISFWLVWDWQGIKSLKDSIFVPLFALLTGKSIVGSLTINELKNILNIMDDLWPIDKFGNKLKYKCEKIHNISLFVSKLFIYFSAISGVFYCISCFSAGNILIKVYTVCDINKSICYYVYGTIEMLFTIIVALSFSCAMDSLFICTFAHCYTSVEVLKYGMEHMPITKKDEESRKNFKEIILQHQVILKYYSALKYYFDLHIFVTFSCCFGSLILVLFLITSDEVAGQMHLVVINMTFCLGTIFEMLIYCFWGSVINDQIQSICNSTFAMDWWEDKSVRNDLVFMIARTQNVPYLSVGKLAPVDLELFIAIMKTSFSVYTLLTSFEEIE